MLPYSYYFIWAIIYYILNFHVKEKKIREREYYTLFVYYKTKPWAKKILESAGPGFAPLVFMLFHLLFFTTCHILALFSFYYEPVQSFFVTLWLSISVWNGACYYVKLFEYEKLTSF